MELSYNAHVGHTREFGRHAGGMLKGFGGRFGTLGLYAKSLLGVGAYWR